MSSRVDRKTLESRTARALQQGLDRDPRDLLKWAYDLLGDGLMMTTAFGKSGMVILHMVHDTIPELPIHFIDTRYHFPETLEYIETVEKAFGLKIRRQMPLIELEDFHTECGDKLYETDPDRCCHINKVQPMDHLLKHYQGWIAGLRRDQGATRRNTDPIEILEPDRLKVHPLVYWTRAEVESYLTEHDIPLHPLFSRGYLSIGCAPCTRPASDPTDERSGRWAGQEKTECGLHLFRKKAQSQKSPEAGQGAGSAPGSSPAPGSRNPSRGRQAPAPVASSDSEDGELSSS